MLFIVFMCVSVLYYKLLPCDYVKLSSCIVYCMVGRVLAKYGWSSGYRVRSTCRYAVWRRTRDILSTSMY